ncbi:hypothetical protein JW948_12810 [bacterium]|nr:hypothetical protein [bacterium]
MRLITFTYEIDEQDQAVFFERVKALELFWKSQGFDFAIYRDLGRKTKLMHCFYTEQSVDELSYLIQEHPEAKSLFEEIRESAGKILVNVMEQMI